ncbi:MAG: hypothetical protein IT163_07275 [Bryobacterales bacterium]|nr:hypothetical protein [Bryobacterales bacterium]
MQIIVKIISRFIPCAVALSATWAFAAGLRPDSVTELPFTTSTVPSVWSGGALMRLEDADTGRPRVEIFDRNGSKIAGLTIAIPGASQINVLEGCFSRGRDGTVAVCGSAYNSASQGFSFLAIFAPGAEHNRVVRTSPYKARRVAVLADGSIWTLGHEAREGVETDPAHHVVRRYRADGTPAGSWLPNNSFANKLDKWHVDRYSEMAASATRAGWVSQTARAYVEFDASGRMTAQVPMPPNELERHRISGLALCDDGRVVLGLVDQQPATAAFQLFELDRDQAAFQRIATTERVGSLIGCEEGRLAAGGTRLGGPVIRWLAWE